LRERHRRRRQRRAYGIDGCGIDRCDVAAWDIGIGAAGPVRGLSLRFAGDEDR
jgi:hypothetical protein